MKTVRFRPAAEIVITARRIARHTEANFDNTTPPSTADRPQPVSTQGDRRDPPPGPPPWWPTFTKAMAGTAAAGVLMCLAGLHLLGITVAAAAAAHWGLARLATLRNRDVP